MGTEMGKYVAGERAGIKRKLREKPELSTKSPEKWGCSFKRGGAQAGREF